jgi:hypothetical protein
MLGESEGLAGVGELGLGQKYRDYWRTAVADKMEFPAPWDEKRAS